jgi:rsbT antagonist protein RsbS
VARLRGATTVVVGIQPEVAYAMVRFGITLDPMRTALDLEEGLALLDQLTDPRRPGRAAK